MKNDHAFRDGEELNSCKNSKCDQWNNEKVFSLPSGGRRLVWWVSFKAVVEVGRICTNDGAEKDLNINVRIGTFSYQQTKSTVQSFSCFKFQIGWMYRFIIFVLHGEHVKTIACINIETWFKGRALRDYWQIQQAESAIKEKIDLSANICWPTAELASFLQRCSHGLTDLNMHWWRCWKIRRLWLYKDVLLSTD